jgi:hypothetical protein
MDIPHETPLYNYMLIKTWYAYYGTLISNKGELPIDIHNMDESPESYSN